MKRLSIAVISSIICVYAQASSESLCLMYGGYGALFVEGREIMSEAEMLEIIKKTLRRKQQQIKTKITLKHGKLFQKDKKTKSHFGLCCNDGSWCRYRTENGLLKVQSRRFRLTHSSTSAVNPKTKYLLLWSTPVAFIDINCWEIVFCEKVVIWLSGEAWQHDSGPPSFLMCAKKVTASPFSYGKSASNQIPIWDTRASCYQAWPQHKLTTSET